MITVTICFMFLKFSLIFFFWSADASHLDNFLTLYLLLRDIAKIYDNRFRGYLKRINTGH